MEVRSVKVTLQIAVRAVKITLHMTVSSAEFILIPDNTIGVSNTNFLGVRGRLICSSEKVLPPQKKILYETCIPIPKPFSPNNLLLAKTMNRANMALYVSMLLQLQSTYKTWL